MPGKNGSSLPKSCEAVKTTKDTFHYQSKANNIVTRCQSINSFLTGTCHFTFQPDPQQHFTTKLVSKKVISPTDNSLQRTGNSYNKKVVVTSNSLCAGPRPLRLTENRQGEVLLREVPNEVGNTSTAKDQQVDEQASDEEESETLNREETAGITSNGDIHHRRDLSKKVSVKDEAPKEDGKDYIRARGEDVSYTAHIEYFQDKKFSSEKS